MDVFVLYRDLRTYGEKELLYKEAREQGVLFIRFDLNSKPQVEQTADGKLKLTVTDPILGLPVVLQPDLLALAAAVLPNPTEELGELFKVSRNAEGFFAEAHAKLRPVDFATDGIFMAGLAHYPKPMDESIAQAKAAAGRAATVLAQEQVEVEPHRLHGGPISVHRLRPLRGQLSLRRHTSGGSAGARLAGRKYLRPMQRLWHLRRRLSPAGH